MRRVCFPSQQRIQIVESLSPLSLRVTHCLERERRQGELPRNLRCSSNNMLHGAAGIPAAATGGARPSKNWRVRKRQRPDPQAVRVTVPVAFNRHLGCGDAAFVLAQVRCDTIIVYTSTLVQSCYSTELFVYRGRVISDRDDAHQDYSYMLLLYIRYSNFSLVGKALRYFHVVLSVGLCICHKIHPETTRLILLGALSRKNRLSVTSHQPTAFSECFCCLWSLTPRFSCTSHSSEFLVAN